MGCGDGVWASHTCASRVQSMQMRCIVCTVSDPVKRVVGTVAPAAATNAPTMIRPGAKRLGRVWHTLNEDALEEHRVFLFPRLQESRATCTRQISPAPVP